MINVIKEEFEKFLKIIIDRYYSGEDVLSQSIKYALESKGKRVRPILCMLSCMFLEKDFVYAMPAALAIEMAHTYSLVHDDLPSMDNDSLRRGRPTVHVVFGEANAILCGDALLTDSFAILSQALSVMDKHESKVLSFKQIISLFQEFSLALGTRGMVLGQSLDMLYMNKKEQFLDISKLNDIHLNKTGALLGASCAMGAICADATSEIVNRMRQFGKLVGLAFQIIDDVLDSQDGLGKTANKDVKQNKFTYLKFMSPQEAVIKAENYTKEALSLIDDMKGQSYEYLKNFVLSLLRRTY